MKRYLFMSLLLCMAQAQSAIQIESSRIIYSGNSNSASVKINNISTENYIVQSWLDKGTDKGGEKPPLVVTPPLVKLKPEQSAILRFIYSGNGLPVDRESIFWLNVQEVPPKSKQENVLQLAIRTRLKLFYRPPQVKNTLVDVVKKMSWQIKDNQLLIKNDGPLHITLISVAVADKNGKVSPVNIPMVSPFSTLVVPVAGKTRVVKMNYINDYGAVVAIQPATK
ncbi:fimbrial biogenesis chaperone [Buttiauxella noackiae]|uniref:Periplasmic fimbrial chaperone n=1 Tax=Buttiauxella noackiae ATCC 51607 TaxID=1354255 RepID=A0A1B7HUT8_9ENTR|nr:molecular chaperone [Buttiauxella noackiae]OAT19398.1 periplasmic fimbrial chaperone [Buttiauxella noackiae ATCC 51607]